MVEFAEKINKHAGPNRHAVWIFCRDIYSKKEEKRQKTLEDSMLI